MNMCDRLIHMIGGLATPVDVKLQLIQVFQHMHHDAETAATVSEHLAIGSFLFYPSLSHSFTLLFPYNLKLFSPRFIDHDVFLAPVLRN